MNEPDHHALTKTSGSQGLPAAASGPHDTLTRAAEPLAALPSAQATPGASTPAADTPGEGFVDHGRFPPGQVLAGRYRVTELLGRGGMGEVYRADDLTLSQTIAVKFLAQTRVGSTNTHADMHREVRVARQISHPNVCRVYDIGEYEGHPFITMEYIDGENLAALLKRIGRFPPDKALELARQLCSGIAAAHSLGVLHRDLKPSNVMIDGRGRVRITDFGLAGVAEQFRAADIRAGTPAYMAPEQLAGREVSRASDIYALGLVLYEMFTGKPAFQAETLDELMKLHNDSTPTHPSSIVPEIDPLAARVVLRCLDKDPRKRPASALAVSAALPGGDPLAAALAAGETPSPEMVAAAGSAATLSTRSAVACLVVGLLTVLAALLFNREVFLFGQVELARSDQTLVDRAQDLLRGVGHVSAPRDKASGFIEIPSVVDYLSRDGWTKSDRALLSQLQPTPIQFWYRQSPQRLVAQDAMGIVTPIDPSPLALPGMASLRTDTQGRLIELIIIPPRDFPGSQPARVEWDDFLELAGFPPERLRPATPRRAPPVFSTQVDAWDAASPDNPALPVHIIAASAGGLPTYFRVFGAWELGPSNAEQGPPSVRETAEGLLWILGLVGGALLAWLSLHLGRGDRRGALRLAAVALVVNSLRWALQAHHVFVPATQELRLIAAGLGMALYWSLVIWLLYIGLEPFVRRWWPDALIGWTRLLSGRFRDPLVGQDVLLGVALGGVTHATYLLLHGLPHWLDMPAARPTPVDLATLTGANRVLATVLACVGDALLTPMLGVVMLLLARFVFRRTWAAAVAVSVLYTVIGVFGQHFAGPPGSYLDLASGFLLSLVWVAVMVRYGLLAFLAGLVSANLLGRLVVSPDLGAWYAPVGLVGPFLVTVLTVYAFAISTSALRLVRGVLEEA